MTQQRESKLLTEFLRKQYPHCLQWKRVRLGPLPDEVDKGYYKVTLRWVDAVVYRDRRILLIEAKMKPTSAAVGQLNLYEKLFPQTSEFSEFAHLPIDKMLLTTYVDKNVLEMCLDNNIIYQVYCPQWAADYLKEKYNMYVPTTPQ